MGLISLLNAAIARQAIPRLRSGDSIGAKDGIWTITGRRGDALTVRQGGRQAQVTVRDLLDGVQPGTRVRRGKR